MLLKKLESPVSVSNKSFYFCEVCNNHEKKIELHCVELYLYSIGCDSCIPCSFFLSFFTYFIFILLCINDFGGCHASSLEFEIC